MRETIRPPYSKYNTVGYFIRRYTMYNDFESFGFFILMGVVALLFIYLIVF